MRHFEILEKLSGARRFAAGKKHAPRFGVGFERANHGGILPIFVDAFVHRKSLLGEADGILEQILPWKFSKALVHPKPAADSARHCDTVDAIGWHALDTLA